MSKSQKTKNEQQKDLCITSEQLTEQWKKGELPSGWYWVKMSYQDAIIPLYYSEDYGFKYDDHFYDFEEISEVLDKVPSYEQWKSSNKLILTLMDNIKDKSDLLQRAIVKNVELKELLKKHRDTLARTLALCIDLNFGEKQKNKFADDIAEIDQVLGEE